MPRLNKFSEADIEFILTSELSTRVLAKKLGCHHSAISQIRLGKTHKQFAPEVSRWSKGASCTMCSYWSNNTCSLGHPDPIEEGTSFAKWCSTYEPILCK